MDAHAHINEVIFAGDVVKIGRWRLPATHPRFANSGPARHYLFVFPRTSAWIRHVGGKPFVADANIVTYYNREQEYMRGVIAAVGDWCDYYAIDPGVLRQVVSTWDPAAADEPHRILRFTHGPSDAESYLAQRAVFSHARSTASPDRLFVESTMVDVLARVVGLAYGTRASRLPANVDVVEHAREILARRFASPLSLTGLAAGTGVSIFHLCRLFRALTGETIHGYRNQLRLRAALHALLDSRAALSDVALSVGYSSHSHFTAAFRRAFGVTPSQVRRESTCRRMPRSTFFPGHPTAPRTAAAFLRRGATT